MALGTDSIADRDNRCRWVCGQERQITNVAAGTEDTDAVNKAQLDEVGKRSSDTSHFFKATAAMDSDGGALTSKVTTRRRPVKRRCASR